MTDNTELKRLAEALISANGAYMDDECNIEKREAFHAADDALQDALSPEVVLALIAENERLVAWREGLLKERAAHIRQRDQLKAENEALLEAMTQIMRVTKIGDEAFDIACLVVGELCADAAMSKG